MSAMHELETAEAALGGVSGDDDDNGGSGGGRSDAGVGRGNSTDANVTGCISPTSSSSMDSTRAVRGSFASSPSLDDDLALTRLSECNSSGSGGGSVYSISNTSQRGSEGRSDGGSEGGSLRLFGIRPHAGFHSRGAGSVDSVGSVGSVGSGSSSSSTRAVRGSPVHDPSFLPGSSTSPSHLLLGRATSGAANASTLSSSASSPSITLPPRPARRSTGDGDSDGNGGDTRGDADADAAVHSLLARIRSVVDAEDEDISVQDEQHVLEMLAQLRSMLGLPPTSDDADDDGDDVEGNGGTEGNSRNAHDADVVESDNAPHSRPNSSDDTTELSRQVAQSLSYIPASSSGTTVPYSSPSLYSSEASTTPSSNDATTTISSSSTSSLAQALPSLLNAGTDWVFGDQQRGVLSQAMELQRQMKELHELQQVCMGYLYIYIYNG